MTEDELREVAVDVVTYALAHHGEAVRIHPQKENYGWVIIITDPDKDH